MPQISPRTLPPVAHIVGGSEAIPHSWPWQVSLRDEDGQLFFRLNKIIMTYQKVSKAVSKTHLFSGKHECGGSLVRHNMVVTAGHCEPK